MSDEIYKKYRKFKPGDKVLVLSDEDRRAVNEKMGCGSPGFNKTMEQVSGLVCTIKKWYGSRTMFNKTGKTNIVMNEYILEESGFYWREDWLISLDEVEEKFELGLELFEI